MGKTRIIELTDEQRAALEQGYRKGRNHAFRLRCQMALLKSEKPSSVEIAQMLGCCEVVINTWLNRFEHEGITRLQPRAGRGRKPKLSTQNPVHLQKVRAEIANNFRRSLKSRQMADERAAKEKLLRQAWQLYLAGRIGLYLGDESTFSMKAALPYGWAPKGERI